MKDVKLASIVLEKLAPIRVELERHAGGYVLEDLEKYLKDYIHDANFKASARPTLKKSVTATRRFLKSVKLSYTNAYTKVWHIDGDTCFTNTHVLFKLKGLDIWSAFSEDERLTGIKTENGTYLDANKEWSFPNYTRCIPTHTEMQSSVWKVTREELDRWDKLNPKKAYTAHANRAVRLDNGDNPTAPIIAFDYVKACFDILQTNELLFDFEELGKARWIKPAIVKASGDDAGSYAIVTCIRAETEEKFIETGCIGTKIKEGLI